jgi:hypothetical protein
VIYTFFSVGKMPPSYLFLSPAEHSFRWLCSLRTPLHGLLILLGALRSLTEDRSVDLSVSDSMLLLSTVKRKDRVQTRISFTFFPPFNSSILTRALLTIIVIGCRRQIDRGQVKERLKLESYGFAGLLTKNHGY